MLRSSGRIVLRHQTTARRWLVSTTSSGAPLPAAPFVLRSSRSVMLPASSITNRMMQQQQPVRALSTESNKNKGGDTDDGTKEIVLTPGEKVAVASRLSMWAGVAAFAAVCAFYIAKELIPTKMSPNRVFDRSFDMIRNDPEVQRRYGDALKAYGRDHGGHREGRRNFIEHTEYQDEQDGSKRTRVRYNIEGRFGNAFVFAEVSNAMSSGEFVYILVQDKTNGRTYSVVDNRAALTAERLAGGNKEVGSAMSQLLTGNGKK